jgi:hypothetical protein
MGYSLHPSHAISPYMLRAASGHLCILKIMYQPMRRTWVNTSLRSFYWPFDNRIPPDHPQQFWSGARSFESSGPAVIAVILSLFLQDTVFTVFTFLW